jgi:hypothetical protein
LWASGISATCPSTKGSRAVRAACSMVSCSMSLAQLSSLGATCFGCRGPSRRPPSGLGGRVRLEAPARLCNRVPALRRSDPLDDLEPLADDLDRRGVESARTSTRVEKEPSAPGKARLVPSTAPRASSTSTVTEPTGFGGGPQSQLSPVQPEVHVQTSLQPISHTGR